MRIREWSSDVCSSDLAVDHHRRYEREELRRKLEHAGFRVEHLRFFNVPGILGWSLNGKVLRRRVLPGGQLKLFDLLVPIFRLEERLALPFVLSLLTVISEQLCVWKKCFHPIKS